MLDYVQPIRNQSFESDVNNMIIFSAVGRGLYRKIQDKLGLLATVDDKKIRFLFFNQIVSRNKFAQNN